MIIKIYPHVFFLTKIYLEMRTILLELENKYECTFQGFRIASFKRNKHFERQNPSTCVRLTNEYIKYFIFKNKLMKYMKK